MIQPLGSQVIIRTIPQGSWKGIIIPDSAKKSTNMGEKGPEDAFHFVEAEVVAVGPGNRTKGDARILGELADALETTYLKRCDLMAGIPEAQDLVARARNDTRIPLTVKPGDRILYHPAVQRFDRNISGALSELEGNCFIIREDSILAVIEE